MDEITSRADYLSHFSESTADNARQREALKQALDIRKFEIDLYWKRTTYFWTIIAAIFAGYFLLHKDGTQEFGSAFIVSNLGFVFSLGWYFVNRGSKAWQRNWEAHVDLLEDEIMGPLYKTGLNRHSYSFFNFTEAYPFSVSKINQILSLFVAATWLFLILHSLQFVKWNVSSDCWTLVAISSLTVLAVFYFFMKGKTSKTDAEIHVTLRQRKYVDKARP